MGNWDSAKIVTEQDARSFNQLLANDASPLIKKAIDKAGKELLTPANLERYVSSSEVYPAYGDYAQAFEKLVQARPKEFKIENNSPFSPNRIVRDYFIDSSAGLFRLFQCFERTNEVYVLQYDAQSSLTLEDVTCPDGDPKTNELKLSPDLRTKIVAAKAEVNYFEKKLKDL